MKTIFALCILCSSLLGAEPAGTPPPGIVILELFTTEACFSCPPAEKNLQEITRSAHNKGMPVHLIAYHVTVFDAFSYGAHGMWKDPFGNEQWTTLLEKYSEIHPHPKGGIITPSIFVNGNRPTGKKISTLVDEALQIPTSATVEASLTVDGRITYKVTGGDKGDQVILILRESKLSSNITAGENHDKTLNHEYVARWRMSLPLEKAPSGTVKVVVPKDVNLSNADILIFVQNPALGVRGATVLPLPTKPTKPTK
jgi:hypothetical protein